MTDATITSYDIRLSIMPSLGEIRSTATVQCLVAERTDSIRFLLHRNLSINQLTGAKVDSFSAELGCAFPFTPEAATAEVKLDSHAKPGETISFTVSYAGNLARIPQAWGVNCVTENWTELGMYGPWFPWQPATQPTFTYSVDIDVPHGFSVVGLGRTGRTLTGWRLTSINPQKDLIVIAAPNLETITRSDGDVSAQVHFIEEGKDSKPIEAKAAMLAEDALWILKYYRNWFRDDSDKTSFASVVMSPRTTGGGYARSGLVVLSNAEELLSRSQGVFGYIAHEFAHLWWTGAPPETWEDWLNEGLAEYSRLLAIRDRLGQEAFDSLVERKRKSIVGSPPIRGILRTSEDAQRVLYDKASLVLLDLASAVGQDKIDAVLCEFASFPQKDTRTFMDLVKKQAGQVACEEVERLLSQ